MGIQVEEQFSVGFYTGKRFSGVSNMLLAPLPWAFFLLAIPSEAVTSSCFVCSGNTLDSSRNSLTCMGGEDEATTAACVAPNNHGCRVKASEAAGGKILWERSCCSEASCQEQSNAQSKIFVKSCTADDCNHMDPSNGVLPHDTDDEVPEDEMGLHEVEEGPEATNDATSNLFFNSILVVAFALHFV